MRLAGLCFTAESAGLLTGQIARSAKKHGFWSDCPTKPLYLKHYSLWRWSENIGSFRSGDHPEFLIMKKVMLKTTLGLAVTLASTQIFAAGFAINEQSISGMGTGFAGRSSVADDASTIYGNPAGMSRLKREQVTGGVALLDAHTDI
ncbi:MAG: outer membrane protein transport protein, partial [Pseudomonas sp.]